MSVHSDDIALKCARPRLLHRVYTNSKNCVFISFFREISPHFGSLPPPEGSSTLPPALVVSPVVGFLFSPGRLLKLKTLGGHEAGAGGGVGSGWGRSGKGGAELEWIVGGEH